MLIRKQLLVQILLAGKDFHLNMPKITLFEIPVVYQLSEYFSRNGFYSDIQYHFHRTKKHPENVEEIYDGALYKKLSRKGGLLSCPDNVSFLMNTDGVPVCKSSKVSIWPLYLVINELNYSKRMAYENMILTVSGLETKSQLQYCAKVTQAKCTNFVLCSRELSWKVRVTISCLLGKIYLEQRTLFRRLFGT